MTRKFHVVTYGCQMNDFDSQRIRGLLQSRGFELEEDPGRADVIFLNTCSVRDKAEHKVFSQIGVFRKYKRENPDLILGVAGCMAQEHGNDLIRQIPEIDLVVGPQNVYRIPELLQGILEGGASASRVAIEENELVQPIEHETVVRSSSVKAYITVMEGCDYLCSFCIVPYTRGREKCRPPEQILDEARWLCSQGYSELTLLGQTVNKYRHGDTTFAHLLRQLDGVPGLRRIRFTSPYPNDFTNELIDAMAELSSVCEQVHMPVQSGSSRVLKKMRRRYTREEYLERVERIRDRMPGCGLSTDIIVGFPSETEAEFQETLSLLEIARFDHVFGFAYSERPGTGAARMPDDVPAADKSRRLNELFAVQLPIARSINEALVGSIQEVLVEGPSGREEGQLSGRTRTHKIVNFLGDCQPGELIQARIVGATAHSLQGEFVTRSAAAPIPASSCSAPPHPELIQIF